MSEHCDQNCAGCSADCGERKACPGFQGANSGVKKVIGIVSGKGGKANAASLPFKIQGTVGTVHLYRTKSEGNRGVRNAIENQRVSVGISDTFRKGQGGG